MTPNARDRCANILIERLGRMTILAGERGMPSEERESCQLVTLNHVSDLPGLLRVTTRTIRSEFGLMHINMTGYASLRRARELQFFVTTDAARRLMLALQREAGRCMIKGTVAADLPGICRVTCLAWQLEFPVRRCLS
jgi:hypothetical protein